MNVVEMKIVEKISTYDFTSFDDLTSGMIDNMSDDDIDDALRFYNTVARTLHMGNHPEHLTIYLADENDFDTSRATTVKIFKGEDNARLRKLNDVEFVTDEYGSQINFFFRNEKDANKVLDALKYLDESLTLNEENSDFDETSDDYDYEKLFNDFANTTYLITKKNNSVDTIEGGYELEIDVDYRDNLSDEDAYKIITSKHPKDTFYDMITDAYYDSEIYYMDELFKEFDAYLESKNIPTDYDIDYLRDSIGVAYPEEHFLNQKFNCRIIVDTGDANYDYTLNPNYDDAEIENEKASIVWLAKQQGKTIDDLNNALLGDVTKDKFLTSVYEEAANTSSHINALTFLCQATLQQLIDFKENKSSITLNKPYMCGFFDPFNGGGSIMELAIDTVTIPYEFVDEFVPDVSKGGRYSVNDVYGLVSKAYSTSVILSNNENESLTIESRMSNSVKEYELKRHSDKHQDSATYYYAADKHNNRESSDFDYEKDAVKFATKRNYYKVMAQDWANDDDGEEVPEGEPYTVWINPSLKESIHHKVVNEDFIDTNDINKRIDILVNMNKVMKSLNDKDIAKNWFNKLPKDSEVDAFGNIATDDSLYNNYKDLFIDLYKIAQSDGLKNAGKDTVLFARKIDDILNLDEYISNK